MIKFINIVTSIILIIFQQGLIIVLGLLIYSQNSNAVGLAFFLLCIPMLYINYLTSRYVLKYGIVHFLGINADTSEIDIPKDKRWHNENEKIK